MLLLSCSHLRKHYGERLIIDLPELKIYDGDRVGIVGSNGAGKSTLLRLLSQQLDPDEGFVRLFDDFTFITQLSDPEETSISPETASRFGIAEKWADNFSGGEKTRFKLAVSFEEGKRLVFADEPTSDLDLEGIKLMEKCLAQQQGGLLIVSHDRSILDHLCNKILEVEQGRIKAFTGNYSAYQHEKKMEREHHQFEYEKFIAEKKRLEQAIVGLKESSQGVRKAPKRMGNSEARLHKMGNQKAKMTLDNRRRAMESRLQQLEVKDRPSEIKEIRFDLTDQEKVHSKVIIEGKNLNKAYGKRKIFEYASFFIEKGAKVALIGPNGSGKSTLIKMIVDQEDGIKVAPAVKLGYFSQDSGQLIEDSTILENVSLGVYSECFARTLLARLLFKGEHVHKKISTLSGGERIKVAFAKMILGEYNVLVMDEPTNHLDIQSLEVVEEALANYQNTLLFVSHDRRLIHRVADHVMVIKQGKIELFRGNYQEYLDQMDTSRDPMLLELEKEYLLLENRLSGIIARLSLPQKGSDLSSLDNEYEATLIQLKGIRKRLSESRD